MVKFPDATPINNCMKISEVVAKLGKKYDPTNDESEVGSYVSGDITSKEKIVVLPMNQIRSRFEGDDKADPKFIDARSNIENFKKQIKKDISKIPPILVRRLPKHNTYQVIDGHHRYFAFREMNIKKIPAVILNASQITGDKYKD